MNDQKKPHDRALERGYYTLGDAISELIRLSVLCGRDKRVHGSVTIHIPHSESNTAKETWKRDFNYRVKPAKGPTKDH